MGKSDFEPHTQLFCYTSNKEIRIKTDNPIYNTVDILSPPHVLFIRTGYHWEVKK